MFPVNNRILESINLMFSCLPQAFQLGVDPESELVRKCVKDAAVDFVRRTGKAMDFQRARDEVDGILMLVAADQRLFAERADFQRSQWHY